MHASHTCSRTDDVAALHTGQQLQQGVPHPNPCVQQSQGSCCPLSPACAAVCAGKKAYERGQYENSVSFLEQAVEKAGKATILGGEAMMWLALAYQVGSSRPAKGGGAALRQRR